MTKIGVVATAAAAAVLVSSVAAQAADLRPVYKAPSPAVAVYDWTGFYIGGHVGGGWSDSTSTNVNGTPPFPAGTVGTNEIDGVIAGGQIGYNFMFAPNWLIGVEGEVSWTNMDGDASQPSVVPAFVGIRTSNASTEIDWIATVSGRIGYAFNNLLLYAKGGGAWAEFSNTGVTINPVTGAVVGTAEGSETRPGYIVGGGLEWGFAGNWSAKVEYNYINLTDTVERNVTFSAAPGPNPLIRDVETEMHLVKFGINYRF